MINISKKRVSNVADDKNIIGCNEIENLRHILREAMPDMKFTLWRSNAVWVYHERDLYCAGFIEWDYDREVYILYSRRIKNNRFVEGFKEFNTATTKNMKTAIRKAKQYLVPFTMMENMEITVTNALFHFMTARRELEARIGNLFVKTLGVSPYYFMTTDYKQNKQHRLIAELRHLCDTGYKFLSEEFEAKLKRCFHTVDTNPNHPDLSDMHYESLWIRSEWYKWSNRPGPYKGQDLITELMHLYETGYKFQCEEFSAQLKEYFDLVLYENEGGTRVDVWYVYEGADHIDVMKVVNLVDDQANRDYGETTTYTDTESMPELLQGRLALLKLLAPAEDGTGGEYVKGVGYNAGCGVYYVDCR